MVFGISASPAVFQPVIIVRLFFAIDWFLVLLLYSRLTIFRYPVVAAEILACEEDKIEKALLEQGDFGKFFTFFKAKKVNVLLSNVVGKVLSLMLETHSDKVSYNKFRFLLPQDS